MTDAMNYPLPPGSVIGILGGGQLGQMLAVAGNRLGYKTHILSDKADSPACRVASSVSIGSYDDIALAKHFALSCDVVTYEFENISAEVAEAALNGSNTPGSVRTLAIAQDRYIEKSFIRDHAGVNVTSFIAVDSIESLETAIDTLGTPCILKTRRFGYDGKGQVVIHQSQQARQAWDKLAPQPCILEAFIAYQREISVILARSRSGDIRTYPVIENHHIDGILHTSLAPAPHTHNHALESAQMIAEALDYVGVMAVEFFETQTADICVNEIAPRVHNSGHWTQNAGCIDQFEQHIRAVAGLPLGDPKPAHCIRMTNLIGKDALALDAYYTHPETFIHLYGKGEARAKRKMGHVNQIVRAHDKN